MNKERRKEIDKALVIFGKIQGELADAKSIIDQAAQDERDYYDNMPENMQQGEKGQAADNAAQMLEEVQGKMDDFDVDEIINNLEEAKT